MSEFHDRMRALSVRMINRFGSGHSATFTRTVRSNHNPIAGTETITPTPPYTVPVVVDDDASREEGRVGGWDVRFYIPVTGFVPEVGDSVALPGRSGSFTVIPPIEAPAPDGDVIMYTVRARQG